MRFCVTVWRVRDNLAHKVQCYIHLFVASEPCLSSGQADSDVGLCRLVSILCLNVADKLPRYKCKGSSSATSDLACHAQPYFTRVSDVLRFVLATTNVPSTQTELVHQRRVSISPTLSKLSVFTGEAL